MSQSNSNNFFARKIEENFPESTIQEQVRNAVDREVMEQYERDFGPFPGKVTEQPQEEKGAHEEVKSVGYILTPHQQVRQAVRHLVTNKIMTANYWSHEFVEFFKKFYGQAGPSVLGKMKAEDLVAVMTAILEFNEHPDRFKR
jgi:hypothetical protein